MTVEPNSTTVTKEASKEEPSQAHAPDEEVSAKLTEDEFWRKKTSSSTEHWLEMEVNRDDAVMNRDSELLELTEEWSWIAEEAAGGISLIRSMDLVDTLPLVLIPIFQIALIENSRN